MTKPLNSNIRKFEIKQMVVAGLGLLFVIGVSIIVNSLHLDSVAHQTSKFISRLVQVQDFREIGLTLEDTRLNGFSRIQFSSTRPGRDFSLPEGPHDEDLQPLWHFLVTERISILTTEEADYQDTITFEFNRFRLVPYAILAWMILVIVSIPQTRFMKQKFTEQFEKDMAAKQAEVKADIARQVRHNLRTPLAALIRIPERLPDALKADRELLTSSITHIRSIVSALDDGKPESKPGVESEELYDSLIQSLREISFIVPKTIFFTFEIDDSIVSARVQHVPHEFRALLGNIVNNSIDAIAGTSGRITVTAHDVGGEIRISVEDSGSGFPPENQSHIFEKGFSSKAAGTGIGLYHAKTWVEAWGGRITANSNPGISTKVEISLPIAEREVWYVPRLKFSKKDRLIILDDQQSAHSLWQMRLEEAGVLKQAKFAHTAEEVEAIMETPTADSAQTHYLFDYDIQSKVSGLDILDRLPKECHRYLVTGHFDQANIRQRCKTSGVCLLPKGDLPRIPIVVV